jgi:two-component system nitrogen regulation response regulator GlnG
VLQEGEIQRVGGTETIKVNVRVLAATNKDVEELVRGGRFREDLYYRLNVVRIRMPALRDRVEDIPQIVDYFLQSLHKAKKAKVRRVSPEALAILCRHGWPGNVRELENTIYRSAVIASGDAILPKDLPEEVKASQPAAAPVEPANDVQVLLSSLRRALPGRTPDEIAALIAGESPAEIAPKPKKGATKKR